MPDLQGGPIIAELVAPLEAPGTTFQAVIATGRSLSRIAAVQIREMIVSGKLSAGDRLPPERILVKQLGVSHGVLREALQELKANGLLEAHVGRGTFVAARPDYGRSLEMVGSWIHAHHHEIEDLNEIRIAVECLALGGTPRDQLPALRLGLERILSATRDAIDTLDGEGLAQLDSQFHLELCSYTPNRPLKILASGLVGNARSVATVVYSSPVTAHRSLRDHEAIVEALANGRLRGAVAALQRHHQMAWRTAEVAEEGERLR